MDAADLITIECDECPATRDGTYDTAEKDARADGWDIVYGDGECWWTLCPKCAELDRHTSQKTVFLSDCAFSAIGEASSSLHQRNGSIALLKKS
jgi:hypothetical protein